EIDLAFVPESSFADRCRRGPGSASGDPATVRLLGPAERPAAGGGERAGDRRRAVGVEPAGSAADGGADVERVRARDRGDRRVRRAKICWGRVVSFRLRAGAVPGTVCLGQLLQPAGGRDAAGAGRTQGPAAARGGAAVVVSGPASGGRQPPDGV